MLHTSLVPLKQSDMSYIVCIFNSLVSFFQAGVDCSSFPAKKVFSTCLHAPSHQRVAASPA